MAFTAINLHCNNCFVFLLKNLNRNQSSLHLQLWITSDLVRLMPHEMRWRRRAKLPMQPSSLRSYPVDTTLYVVSAGHSSVVGKSSVLLLPVQSFPTLGELNISNFSYCFLCLTCLENGCDVNNCGVATVYFYLMRPPLHWMLDAKSSFRH
jgi:hypothetical protein